MLFSLQKLRIVILILLLVIPSMVVMAESGMIGLPEKSQWLPGVIKRDENGNLYLAEPDIKKPVKTSQVKHAAKAKPKVNKTQILRKDWVMLRWASPVLISNPASVVKNNQTTSSENQSLSEESLRFNVYYWTEKNKKKIKRDAKQKTEFRIEDLGFGKTYFFAVTSYNARGIESLLSKTISVKLEPPSD